MDVIDLRGLPLGAPERKTAYPDEGFNWPEPMRYIHLLNTRWYFDASRPEHTAEAERVISDLCFKAETWNGASDPYKPFRVVIDNFGGTIVGRRS